MAEPKVQTAVGRTQVVIIANRCPICDSANIHFLNCGYTTFNVGHYKCKSCGYTIETHPDSNDSEYDMMVDWNKKTDIDKMIINAKKRADDHRKNVAMETKEIQRLKKLKAKRRASG